MRASLFSARARKEAPRERSTSGTRVAKSLTPCAFVTLGAPNETTLCTQKLRYTFGLSHTATFFPSRVSVSRASWSVPRDDDDARGLESPERDEAHGGDGRGAAAERVPRQLDRGVLVQERQPRIERHASPTPRAAERDPRASAGAPFARFKNSLRQGVRVRARFSHTASLGRTLAPRASRQTASATRKKPRCTRARQTESYTLE